jgi:hypothetical protein
MTTIESLMDELYIRMCREATEIQELRPESSYFPPVKDGEVVSDIMGNRWVSYDTSMEQYRVLLWLPLIEDLLNIYKNKIGRGHDVGATIGIIGRWAFNPNSRHFESFEELFLCFVMERLYNKRWNGTSWDVDEDVDGEWKELGGRLE